MRYRVALAVIPAALLGIATIPLWGAGGSTSAGTPFFSQLPVLSLGIPPSRCPGDELLLCVVAPQCISGPNPDIPITPSLADALATLSKLESGKWLEKSKSGKTFPGEVAAVVQLGKVFRHWAQTACFLPNPAATTGRIGTELSDR